MKPATQNAAQITLATDLSLLIGARCRRLFVRRLRARGRRRDFRVSVRADGHSNVARHSSASGIDSSERRTRIANRSIRAKK